MTLIKDKKVSDMTIIRGIQYGCMDGCSEFEEYGLTACNDCITKWQIYIDYYQSSPRKVSE